jgi:hypothetical protein
MATQTAARPKHQPRSTGPARPAARPAAARTTKEIDREEQEIHTREQELDTEREQATAEGGEATEGDEGGEGVARNYLWTREGSRKIKLRSTRKIANHVDDAVVKTVGGAPDMRFAENRMGYMADPTKKKNGTDDNRFLENRPDILALHADRGEAFPNLLFDEDGSVQFGGEEVRGAISRE